MKPKRVLFWIVFGILTFNIFGYVRMHTRGDVIIYKQFAKAVMKGDGLGVRYDSTPEVTKAVAESQSARNEAFEGMDIVFTYYRIYKRNASEDGRIVSLSAEQISRVNREGQDKLWGAEAVRIRHNVQLVLENDAWIVQSFSDPAIRNQ